MTGFNMPPGCNVSNIPGCGDEGPCAVCCQAVIACVCKECPECGAQGDPNCYRKHGMKLDKLQMIGRQKTYIHVLQEKLGDAIQHLDFLIHDTEITGWDIDDVNDPFE